MNLDLFKTNEYNVFRSNRNGGVTMNINAIKIETLLAERGMTKKDLAGESMSLS